MRKIYLFNNFLLEKIRIETLDLDIEKLKKKIS